MSFVVGLLISAVIYLLLQQMTASQVERNDFLKAEIGKLDTQIKDIATLRSEIDALRARQRAVEDLQSDRNTPVHLLNELARFTPEGVFLQSLRQTAKAVVINGVAASNERVSEMLRNLSHAEWVENPELVEIKVAAVNPKDPRRLFDFSIKPIPGPEHEGARPVAAGPQKYLSFVVLALATVGLGWVAVLSDEQAVLDAEHDKEPKLKEDYGNKLTQAVNLPELRKQKSQVEEYVLQLEKQLPARPRWMRCSPTSTRPAWVAVCSSSSSGRVRSRCATTTPSSRSRSSNQNTPPRTDANATLTMEAIARTYRYLDSSEVEEQKKAAAAAEKKK
ncbi:fimbrial assembly protein (PilN) domain-containing protein [Ditylenchus destructor]|nr:fimbrial assembly protein (PilN) domain-containing protein [Ditylenchus destructor]